MSTQPALAAILEEHALGELIEKPESIGGGDSTPAYQLQTTRGRFFGKRAGLSRWDQLRCEANNLDAIRDTNTIRVPTVIACDGVEDEAWLLLEWLDVRPLRGNQFEALARSLSDLHRTDSSRPGWHENNWIGNSPQLNQPMSDWETFYRECRLRPQIEWAVEGGIPATLRRLLYALMDRLSDLLGEHSPPVSLTHGDLWGGNVAMADCPVTYDPACFFGDREMDLAMARLFGGFDEHFFAAYLEAWPLPPGWQKRVDLYQIYHQLNHLNLFGGIYVDSCRRTVERLLSQI